LAGSVNPDTQLAALYSILRNDGNLDQKVLERMASQAGVEPEDMATTVAFAQEGMQHAIMKHLSPFGVYDQDTFTDFLHSSPQTHQKMVESVRDLVMHNSTKGFEGLAEEFTLAADMVDPEGVAGALEDAGIPFTQQRGGGVVLDLTAQGMGQMAFRQAVQLGIIKLSRNR
jgi:ribulose 1,5-bisphosphate carboxylase large subunit-like protein